MMSWDVSFETDVYPVLYANITHDVVSCCIIKAHMIKVASNPPLQDNVTYLIHYNPCHIDMALVFVLRHHIYILRVVVQIIITQFVCRAIETKNISISCRNMLNSGFN